MKNKIKAIDNRIGVKVAKQEERYYLGAPICRGVAIGKPILLSWSEEPIPDFTVAEDKVDYEIDRYRTALSRSREELSSLQQYLEREKIHEGVNILDAQLQMMEDPLLTTHIEKAVHDTRKNVESVLQDHIDLFRMRFSSLDDPFFRDRFKDIQDISQRILGHLCGSKPRISLESIPPGSILFAAELSASEMAEVSAVNVSGIVTERGGAASHAAVVANAKGTTFVSNIPVTQINPGDHELAVVDGRTGDVILSPSESTLSKYQEIRFQLQQHLDKLNNAAPLKAETFDGYTVRLSANVELASELDFLHEHGGHGVGLFRSEYLFLNRNRFPTEEEQFAIYMDLVVKMRNLPIVIRTFDVGGDKCVPVEQRIYETNPFLGCRAIRFLLKERGIFKAQLRAILMAAAYGDVSVMFPMISTLSELLEAKAVLEEVKSELEMQGELHGAVRIGSMIEVPSAAIIADLLAKECDFLSIGTNDLVQYALAVDRSNHVTNALYTPSHPSVIRLIKLIIHEANHHGIPVTICGEVAADPRFTPLLLGLGVHELSVATRYLPTVKHAIRNTSIIAASQLAERVLTLSSASEIQNLLNEEYRKNMPDDCFYNY
jgi:phosphotransferase system enzyme I (PtsI)